MALKVPFVALDPLLNMLVNAGLQAPGVTIHLYKNAYVPADSSTLANFIEADFDGYAAQGVGVWGPSLEVDPRGVVTAPGNTWIKAAGSVGNMIYGYFMTDSSGNLVWAEADPSAPVPMETPGQSYVVLPRFSLRSEF